MKVKYNSHIKRPPKKNSYKETDLHSLKVYEYIETNYKDSFPERFEFYVNQITSELKSVKGSARELVEAKSSTLVEEDDSYTYEKAKQDALLSYDENKLSYLIDLDEHLNKLHQESLEMQDQLSVHFSSTLFGEDIPFTEDEIKEAKRRNRSRAIARGKAKREQEAIAQAKQLEIERLDALELEEMISNSISYVIFRPGQSPLVGHNDHNDY